ncbi:hypothetical protein Glove_680g20 [Diversispora epigaea]|uniref:Uncharacterized protein n=1 Tax=Diversispora epigaea TaxID=1348612 RepID=A0A397G5S5_9GLOM|nr:hypothetical protein Glove_680g20 [Diversispora epigaea]
MANLTQYLDENYPVSNRSSVINLDLSNKNFVGDAIIIGFVNILTLNYSFNNFNGSMHLIDSENLEDIDGSFINAGGKHWYSLGKLKKLKLSNNRLTAIDISESPNIAYLEFNSNLLSSLDLRNSEKYVEVNCSNNPSLSEITFPSSFDPVLFDCRDTSLGQVTFPNSSVFDCQKNIIVSTTTTMATTTRTTKATATETQTPNNNLGLKIGLSVGIIAMFLFGLITFLYYKYRIRKKRTSILQITGSRNVLQDKEQETRELEKVKKEDIINKEESENVKEEDRINEEYNKFLSQADLSWSQLKKKKTIYRIPYTVEPVYKHGVGPAKSYAYRQTIYRIPYTVEPVYKHGVGPAKSYAYRQNIFMHMHVMRMLITYMAQLWPQKFMHLGRLCLYAVCFYTGSTVYSIYQSDTGDRYKKVIEEEMSIPKEISLKSGKFGKHDTNRMTTNRPSFMVRFSYL